jgi:ABC-type lipoprotein export system ATPase subunit
MKGKLYIIAGCSGVGKGTLLALFLKKSAPRRLPTYIPLNREDLAQWALNIGLLQA